MLARRIAQRLIIVVQGCLMLQTAPAAVAAAFISSRVDGQCGRVYGTLTAAAVQDAILMRAWPV